jgi:tripartite-type tricarboxylate transporter receptor subunit TctC
MELLMLKEKFQITNVPYRGAAPALADLVAGQVQAKLDNYTQSAQFIADRKLAVLAVTSARRLKHLPDVPTVAESLPGFEGYLWMGLVAPAATPDAVIQKLATAARRFVALPETQARFDKDGVEPVGSGPDEFSAQITKEIVQWRELAKTTKITVD